MTGPHPESLYKDFFKLFFMQGSHTMNRLQNIHKIQISDTQRNKGYKTKQNKKSKPKKITLVNLSICFNLFY